MRRRTRILLAVAVVAAVAVAGVFVLTRTDPRPAFAEAAGKACRAAAVGIGDLTPPGDDVESRLALYAQVATINDDLADEIAGIDAPGAAGELRDELVTIVELRRTLLTQARLDDAAAAGTLDDAVTRLGEAWSGTYGDAGELLEEWDADTPCATVPLAGTGALDAAANYTAELSTLCRELSTALAELDADAAEGRLDPDEYFTATAAEIGTARDTAAGGPQHPLERVNDAFATWLGVLDAAADAAAAGDAAQIAALNVEWAAAAQAMEAPDCSDGIVADTATPSGLLIAPEVPTGGLPIPAEGASVPLGPWAVEMLLVRSGASPENGFGLALAAQGLFDGATAVPGSADAGPGISLSEPRTVDGGPASEENVWMVGVALRADGSCVWGRLWGHPTLTGFSTSPAEGPCTGDAALADALADAAVTPPG